MMTAIVIILMVWGILTVISVANEQWLLASTALVVAGGAIGFILGGVAVKAFVASLTVWTTLMYFGFYLFIGLLWSFFKWFRFVKEYATRHALEKDLNDYVDKNIPKARIAGWIGYWPFSAIAWVAADFLRELVTEIANYFGKVYDRITAYAVSRVISKKK